MHTSVQFAKEWSMWLNASMRKREGSMRYQLLGLHHFVLLMWNCDGLVSGLWDNDEWTELLRVPSLGLDLMIEHYWRLMTTRAFLNCPKDLSVQNRVKNLIKAAFAMVFCYLWFQLESECSRYTHTKECGDSSCVWLLCQGTWWEGAAM